MDILTQLIGNVNDVILTYILIIMLLGCAFWFTYKTKFVQFRMIGEMVRLLGDSTGKTEGRDHYIGWSGCSLLDVGNCTFWCQQCLYRIHTCPAI